MFKHRKLFSAVVVALALLLAACSRGAPQAPPSKPPPVTSAPGQSGQADDVPASLKPVAEPYKITIGSVNNVFGVVFWAGVEKGFFLKHGIQAQVKVFQSGQEVAKALTTGDIQLGTSAITNYQQELDNGIRNIGVFTHMGNGASLIMDAPLAITARPDTGIEPDKPETLRGKTIGLAMGGTAEIYLRAVLVNHGVDPDDVEMVNVPPANSVSVMENKTVDAISSWEPYQSLILRDIPGSFVVERGGGHIPYVIFGLVEEGMMKNNPDLVLRMVAAYSEAAAWVRQNPDEAGEITSHWIQGLDPAVAAEALKFVPFDTRITTFSKEAWDHSNDFLLSQNKIKVAPAMEGNFNTSFIEQVVEDHPDYFRDLEDVELLNLR